MTVWRRSVDSNANRDLGQTPEATYCWLPGWGFEADIFTTLIKKLNQENACEHWLMQWPKQPISRHEFVRQLRQQAPANAIWIGWSLGGVLASLAATLDDPQARPIERVLTLATGQYFVQPESSLAGATGTSSHSEMAMPNDIYQQFKAGIQSPNNAVQQKTARRFISLCSQNSSSPRQLSRDIRPYQIDQFDIMAATLAWLEDYQLVEHSAVHQIHCYGQQDAFNIKPHQDGIHCDETGHLFWLMPAGLEFVCQQIPCRDKQLMAQQFSRAAATYDEAATIQQQANQYLFQTAANYNTTISGDWLDIGCGTGAAITSLMQAGASKVAAFDLAEGMVEYARTRYADTENSNISAITISCADADNLPLADQSADGAWSSLMLQWSEHPQTTLQEWFRVLKPKGQLLCATLLPGTHQELKSAWQAIDQQVHVNHFTPKDELMLAAEAAGFEILSCQRQTLTEFYPTLTALLRRLKAIGATNVNPGRRAGLGGRAALKKLASTYPVQADGQLPLTYELCLLVARRPESPEI